MRWSLGQEVAWTCSQLVKEHRSGSVNDLVIGLLFVLNILCNLC